VRATNVLGSMSWIYVCIMLLANLIILEDGQTVLQKMNPRFGKEQTRLVAESASGKHL